jgi:hypothetical protein
MREHSIPQRRKVTKVMLGNAAVDGLLSGLLAGLAMAVYLGAAALAMGERLAVMFSRFTVTAGDSPVSGFLLHLAVSGIYGLVFGFVCRLVCRWPRWVWLVGIAYGGLLWLLATLVLLPGAASSLSAIPVAHLVLAHLVYGGVLGLATQRRILSESDDPPLA